MITIIEKIFNRCLHQLEAKNIGKEKAGYDMEIMKLKRIEPKNAKLYIKSKIGMYFWFDKKDDSIVYIGIALGKKGLRGRIVSQHLRPGYLEYRPERQSEKKDFFQMNDPFIKGNKKGIDKSAFRKSIGRNNKLKPGEETVLYIVDNLYLRVFEFEDKEEIKRMEKKYIEKYQPIFNTTYKRKKYAEVEKGW